MCTRVRAISLVFLVALSAGSGGAAPAVAVQEADEPTRINSCTTITEPGRYVLTRDVRNVTDTCIRIRADDVVLDGQGHTLSGVQIAASREAFTNASLTAGAAKTAGNVSNVSFDVLVENYPTPQTPRWNNVGVAANGTTSLSNVTVRNLTVTRFAFGVYYDDVTDGSVSDVTATDNGDGLGMYSTRNLSITDSRLVDNEWGAFASNASNVALRNVTATDGFVGLNVADASGLVVVNSATRDNDAAGLVLDYVTRSTVTRLNGTDNGYLGVFLGSSTGVTIRDSTLSDSAGEAPRPTPFPDSAALALDNASRNTFVNVTAVDNEWTYYAYNGSTENVARDLSLGGPTVSFTANDSALDVESADTTQNEVSATRLVVRNTSSDSTIDLQATWRSGDGGRADDTDSGSISGLQASPAQNVPARRSRSPQ